VFRRGGNGIKPRKTGEAIHERKSVFEQGCRTNLEQREKKKKFFRGALTAVKTGEIRDGPGGFVERAHRNRFQARNKPGQGSSVTERGRSREICSWRSQTRLATQGVEGLGGADNSSAKLPRGLHTSPHSRPRSTGLCRPPLREKSTRTLNFGKKKN